MQLDFKKSNIFSFFIESEILSEKYIQTYKAYLKIKNKNKIKYLIADFSRHSKKKKLQKILPRLFHHN